MLLAILMCGQRISTAHGRIPSSRTVESSNSVCDIVPDDLHTLFTLLDLVAVEESILRRVLKIVGVCLEYAEKPTYGFHSDIV